MKSVSETYIAKEEAVQRLPGEIYHIWRDGGEHWYHTSGDVSIVYGGNTYTPAYIRRSSAEYDSSLEVSTMTIDIAYLTDPVIDFIAMNPVEILWIEIAKLFRDQDPYEKSIVFIGHIRAVSFKGNAAQAKCVGFEHYLKMSIPRYRYQPGCNNSLYDSKCALAASNYRVDTTLTDVSADGLTLTSADFGSYDDDYFKYGYLIFSAVYKRMIVDHEGSTITLRYKIADLAAEDAVSVYPGCDKSIETCRDKFDNVVNFFGHPYIPIDNPAASVGTSATSETGTVYEPPPYVPL